MKKKREENERDNEKGIRHKHIQFPLKCHWLLTIGVQRHQRTVTMEI